MTEPTAAAPSCRHCGDPLKRQEREGEHWTHGHGRYRCQRKVTYGHNAAHPDAPCVPGGPNPCKCTYAPDEEVTDGT